MIKAANAINHVHPPTRHDELHYSPFSPLKGGIKQSINQSIRQKKALMNERMNKLNEENLSSHMFQMSNLGVF